MHETTVYTDELGRLVIARDWWDARGRHRTAGPAAEYWTVLPCGAHVRSYQGWYLNHQSHRDGRPAQRSWHIAENGTGVLLHEAWFQYGEWHRVGGPSYRRWTVEPDGTRTLVWQTWRVNDRWHRVDGPALNGREFYWFGREVVREDLPWLRRGRGWLTAVAAVLQPARRGDGTSPAWTRDTRVVTTGADSVSNTPPAYRSAVGGAVLQCV